MKKGWIVFVVAVVAVTVGITAFAKGNTEQPVETITCPVSEPQIAVVTDSCLSNTQDDTDTVEGLKAKYGIDSSYEESIDNDFNGYTVYYYTKIDKNGVANPYDALNITVDNETGEIFTYKRFDKPAYIEAKIDEAYAREAAVKNRPQRGKQAESPSSECVLGYYMPDYPKGDVSLAYLVRFDDGVVYIDAVSGKVLGFDMCK